jgi:hypothetical protein
MKNGQNNSKIFEELRIYHEGYTDGFERSTDKGPYIGIEFFCGHKSFTKVAEKHGFDMLTIDFNHKFNPDLCLDMLYATKMSIPKRYRKPFVVWFSPPCESFSLSGNSLYLGFPIKPKAYIGLVLAYKCIEMIQNLKPTYWFIENPRAGLRSVWFMKPLHRKTVTYCQYGERRMKPTDIFTNLESWNPRPACKNGDSCHDRSPRGSRTGTQGEKSSELRAIVPNALCEEVIKSMIKDIGRKGEIFRKLDEVLLNGK